MPELYSDDNGARVVIRHKGPAGKGFPSGGTTGQILAKTSNASFAATWVNPPAGTGAAVGPASATDGNFVLFDGTTGKLLKNSTLNAAYFATKSYADTKQDAEAGKGLSQQNFTTVLKDKLDLLSPKGYRGTFASLAALEAFTYAPVASSGDYATVEVSATDVEVYFYDDINNAWVPMIQAPVAMTGAEIAAELFDSTEVWTQDNCNVFTDTQKAQLAAHESLIGSLGLGGVVKAYGSINYFSLVGTVLTLTGTSDGLSNMYPVEVTTALSGTVTNFDNGGASNGRLRYTGTPSNVFQISANIAIEGAVTGDFVVALAKNGSVIQETRQLAAINASNDVENICLSAVVTLLNNEYLEVFIGRTLGSGDPTVHSLTVLATKIP